jgi:hypothetical protein
MAKSKSTRAAGRSRKSPEILHLGGAQVVPGMDHPKVVAAARKSAAAREATRASFRNALREVNQDLMACRQTLMCAAEALGKAEDDVFEGESGERGVSAIRVVERCVEELVRIEDMVDRLCIKTPQP